MFRDCHCFRILLPSADEFLLPSAYCIVITQHKHLNAYWYSPPQPKYPRIFISELRVQDLPQTAQDILTSYTDEVIVSGDLVDQLDVNNGQAVDEFLHHQPMWRLPTWSDYQALSAVSEYAAWVIYNRYSLNHFTISVHNLPTGYNTIVQFNEFLERHINNDNNNSNIQLNDAGGKVKVSSDGLLIQSSTVAATMNAEFANDNDKGTYDGGGDDGNTIRHEISGSYVEFAERRVKPEFSDIMMNERMTTTTTTATTTTAIRITREHRREGFEVGNADKIFESTFRQQTSKKSSNNYNKNNNAVIE